MLHLGALRKKIIPFCCQSLTLHMSHAKDNGKNKMSRVPWLSNLTSVDQTSFRKPWWIYDYAKQEKIKGKKKKEDALVVHSLSKVLDSAK